MPTFTGDPRLDEVADGVHAFLQPDGGWCLNNAGVLAGRGKSLLIDTAATEKRARLLRAFTDRFAPPRAIVTTHAHGDHTFGNFVFPEALVIGHERTRREAERAGLHLTTLWPEVDWGGIELMLPELTFTEPVAMSLGGHDIELHSFGPAHSGCDTVVWLPRQRVLFAGDLLMSGVTPFVLTGSVRGLQSAVARLRSFGAETIIPGHGPVGGPELLDVSEGYLTWLTDLARAGLAQGVPPLQAARDADLGRFAGLLDSERLAPNLYRAYDEFRGESHDGISDVDQLFAAMVELHGGIPTCRA
ncbi:MBL fold metallo-hydrolase [Parafrankia sp. FMc2]|uniref:MBL fold metallo-hydrolase n=1 Tax=Parafrankia sp. FMc2 TaxID=3233196 RepID=UPI0034D53E1E